jgi:hypothetical protein
VQSGDADVTVLLNPAPRTWWCPNCPVRVVLPHNVTNRYHQCAGLRGLNAPLVPPGVKAKVAADVREDYVGAEDVQYDAAGRPVSFIVTTRDDGNDVVALAPTAYIRED